MSPTLADQTAVVTGASRGIGAAIARTLADVGADIVGCALAADREELDTTIETIDEAGGTAIGIDCDVTDRDDVAALMEATADELGTIDLLVNNAGIWEPLPLEDLDAATWDRITSVILDGTFNCTQLAGPYLRSGGGTVVNIASGAALAGFPNNAPYAAAKAGVANLTETVAFEWAHDDVRVNAVAPGLVATSAAKRGSTLRIPEPSEIDRERVARRIGTPQEIADVVRFLCSPTASFVTGVILPVSGVPRLERAFDVRRSEDGAWIE